jgi:hypothetical protein
MEEITVGRLLLLISQRYGRVMYEVIKTGGDCPVCKDKDFVTLEIVADNNVGLEQRVGYHEPNERVEILSKSCLKVLIKELSENHNTFKVIPKNQEEWYKKIMAREENG